MSERDVALEWLEPNPPDLRSGRAQDLWLWATCTLYHEHEEGREATYDEVARTRRELIYCVLHSYFEELPEEYQNDDPVAPALQRLVGDALKISRALGWESHRTPVPPRVRTLVYRRDGYACVECSADDITQLTIDHRLPVAAAGANDPDNLRTLCRTCNSRKGARL
jgi:hypothetical protein